MSKKITFAPKPILSKSSVDDAGDKWVEQRTSTPLPEVEKKPIMKLKRLTLDIPETLHQAIKVSCAARSTKMVDEIREILANHYFTEIQK